MTLHGDSKCTEIRKLHKYGQRDEKINQASFSQALGNLTGRGFRLGAQASVNDVWLIIDFNDADFEGAVAKYILRILSQRYSRLGGASVQRHC
jgi:hypothetical protein